VSHPFSPSKLESATAALVRAACDLMDRNGKSWEEMNRLYDDLRAAVDTYRNAKFESKKERS
jgi:hypothetical protein